MNKNKRALTLIPYILIPIFIIFAASYYTNTQTQEKTQYYEIVEYFEEGKVSEYTLNLSSGALKFKLKGETNERKYTVPNVSVFVGDVHEDVLKHNAEATDEKDIIKADYLSGSTGNWLINILPTLLFGILLMVFIFFVFRKMNNSVMGENNKTLSFGKARTKKFSDEKRKTTFADVAGADEEKEELSEIVEFLKAPDKFNALGARIPKGVLLVGPPGTGKTLLARAVAGEANAPFFSISGSDFVEMYVGVGASRVRDLFDQAKKSSPSIIFIDEIDAVGRHRGAGMGGGHDEREQTLNQLLVEMDGFGANEGVIIIAATNRPDILDPALLRPGRFDRQVAVGYPDVKGREEILRVHARNKPLGPDVDLSVIAKTTTGFTGADLENLLNEASLLAARKNKKAITEKEIEEATIKVIMGTEKKSRKMTQKAIKLTAYHESGHAITAYFLKDYPPVHEVSIIPRGRAGGYTMYMPETDNDFETKGSMMQQLIVGLGGRVAEELVLGDISTGASGDIQQVTKVARSMVTKYGMSEKIGPILYGDEGGEVFLGRDYSHTRNYSEETSAEIDKEVNILIQNAHDEAKRILTENMQSVHTLAQYLIEYEKIDGIDFGLLMRGELDIEAKEKAREQEREKAKAKEAAERALETAEDESEELETKE